MPPQTVVNDENDDPIDDSLIEGANVPKSTNSLPVLRAVAAESIAAQSPTQPSSPVLRRNPTPEWSQCVAVDEFSPRLTVSPLIYVAFGTLNLAAGIFFLYRTRPS